MLLKKEENNIRVDTKSLKNEGAKFEKDYFIINYYNNFF